VSQTGIVQLDLQFFGEDRMRRVAWRPADGIFQGDGRAVEWCEGQCALARQVGGVTVDPWPTFINTPEPERNAAQLAAALSPIARLPDFLRAALNDAVAQLGGDEVPPGVVP
jgi:hypothetical protein